MSDRREERLAALEALRAVVTERAQLEERERDAVLAASKLYLDWTAIAGALGMSRSAAHRRFGELVRESRRRRW